MRASLDTNVIIHLYRSNQQNILFDLFSDGLFVYSFIVDIELAHHGKDVLPMVLADIKNNQITIIDDNWLKSKGIFSLFRDNFREECALFNPDDTGEAYAIALARTLGVMSIVTDDTKLGGPHATLMRLPESEVIPFAFYEVIILLFLTGKISAKEAVEKFNCVINNSNELSFSFKSKLKFFVKRFIKDPYSERERYWIENYCKDASVDLIVKLRELNRLL